MQSVEGSAAKLDNETERPALRPQRPPPPPPLSQVEPLSPWKLQIVSAEGEGDVASAEPSNVPVVDPTSARPTLLFEFDDLFETFHYESVRQKILDRQMQRCHFTTVLWRIFLHCFPTDSNRWSDTLDASRQKYNELVDSYVFQPHRRAQPDDVQAKNLNHPLSREEQSPWFQYYQYEELKDTIDQDVKRTCPELSFFRQRYILDLLLKVLFVHCRHHEESLPYRQGMHEILAVIVYSIHSESVRVNHYPEASELMKKIYDPQYLEHDAYAIYERIMEHLRQFYDFKTNKNETNNDIKLVPFQRANDMYIQTNDTVMRVNSIVERLKYYDEPLHRKLQELDIEPTVYGIRWLRLLFGREIPFGGIRHLWTVIFCFDKYFGFVDYFFLALLMQVGQTFGKHSQLAYSHCLQQLMRQNVISDTEDVICKALALADRQPQSSTNDPSMIPSIRRADGTRLNPFELEREYAARSKEFTRLSSYRSATSDIQKPISPVQTVQQNPMAEASRQSSTGSSLFSFKPPSTTPTKESEMDVCPGKAVRERLNDNIQLQKCSASYMNRFIDRLRTGLVDMRTPAKEEVLIQLNGLAQIADVLEGRLTLNENALEALVNYSKKQVPVENDSPDTA